MSRRDIGWIAGMGALAAGIWIRDRTWLAAAGQTLPILIGFGLFVWLPWPWRWQEGEAPCARTSFVAALVLGPVGIALDSTLVLALSWTLLLWSWLSVRVAVPARGTLAKLMTLPLLAFPWLANDLPRLGWSFRLSAAWATSGLLALAHVPVVRQGTLLTVRGFPLSIEPACSGMSGLQAILIGGAALACVRLRKSRMFWLSLFLLPAAAWVANLARVCFAATMAATLPASIVDRWLGPLHLVAGWIAVGLVFGACAVLFGAMERWASRRGPPRLSRGTAEPAGPSGALSLRPAKVSASMAGRRTLMYHPCSLFPRGEPSEFSGRQSRLDGLPGSSTPATAAGGDIGSGFVRGARNIPWLEIALLAYAAWAARSLWETWWHAPFERLGALAFIVWLMPVTLGKLGGAAVAAPWGNARRAGAALQPKFWRVRHAWLAGLGIAAVAAGQFGQFHLFCQLGLAALIVSMAPARTPLAWGAGALAWFSALGWIGARWSVPPSHVAAIRLLVAGAAASWEHWSGHRDRVAIPLAYARAK